MPTLHITNGSSAGDKLRHSVDGPVALACDVLHEGPCPPVDGDAWYEVRGQFLAGYAGRPPDQVKASLAAGDRAILDACARSAKALAERTASAERHEIVLWFEHDLFDQLAIIRTLDLMVRLKPDTTPVDSVVSGFSRTPVSLICIDRFPGVDPFHGLGQLTADQLATLAGTRVPVTAGHFSLAVDAWRAFRSPDPSDLLRIAMQLDASRAASSEGGASLPFLGKALLRFLAQFPSADNGLSKTETLALDALLAGPTTAGALFMATQGRESAPFMGDQPFYDVLRAMASARVPLVTLDTTAGMNDVHHRPVAITGAGRDVLACRADHIQLNGIDSWRGGVHLTGSDRSPWRWDAGAETLVS